MVSQVVGGQQKVAAKPHLDTGHILIVSKYVPCIAIAIARRLDREMRAWHQSCS